MIGSVITRVAEYRSDLSNAVNYGMWLSIREIDIIVCVHEVRHF